MREPEAVQEAEAGERRASVSRSTAIRHLVLGFLLLVTILLTAALCSLPR